MGMGMGMAMDMVCGLARLKVPHMQLGCGRAGWQPVDVVPGFDREMVEDGVVKRVLEAIYVTVLAAQTKLVQRRLKGMTASTRTLYERQYRPTGAA